MRPDPRITELAGNLIHYSLELKAGQKLYVDMIGDDTRALGREIIRIATERGIVPFWNCFDDSFSKPFFSQANEQQHREFAAFHQAIMDRVDGYIGIRGASNPYDLGDLSPQQKNWQQSFYWQEVHSKTRLKKRWVVLRYPNATMAVLSKKSTHNFEDFYFKVCNLDYRKMSEAMDSLVSVMQKTDRVRIVSPGTDIEFSIKNIPVIKCDGKVNIPDGEVFTAPIKDSVNGKITYNTTSFYRGTLFKNISLEVKNGKIIKATDPERQAELEQIMNLDEGARYFGEFAIGLNPFILDPMNDTLFDEKIAGSIHLTPGSSYDDAFNGNKSAVHWDLVLIQRPEYGGGEIYFDGKLVRKDGKFVIPELKVLDSDFS